jgi:hypothetical protein
MTQDGSIFYQILRISKLQNSLHNSRDVLLEDRGEGLM